MPAAAAGPPFVALCTSKPSLTGRSRASLSQPPTGSVSTPRNARCTRPSVMRSLAMDFAVLIGMAKPIPAVVPVGVRIDERPAGIAAIDGGVGLNGFVDKSRLTGLHGAAKRADDAGGEGGLKAERISDS